MYAVIKTGGKQYRVQPGQRFTVEKLAGDTGDTIEFGEVLMLGGDAPTIGAPFVDGAVVRADVVEQTKAKKVLNLKRRRRKSSSRRLKGHRQQLTLVEISEIVANGETLATRPERRSAEPAPAAHEDAEREDVAAGSADAAADDKE